MQIFFLASSEEKYCGFLKLLEASLQFSNKSSISSWFWLYPTKTKDKDNGKIFKKLESLKNSYLRNVKISPEISKQIFGTHQLKFSNIGV